MRRGMLTPADLSRFDPNSLDAALAYLNLPPVGAFADAHGAPGDGGRETHELPAALRASVEARRERTGGARLERPEDLIGLAQVGEAEIAQIIARLADRERYGHRVTPIWGGPAADRAFFDLIESAQRYIHISTYIVGGEVGVRLAKLLARKQREGVRVRLMFCATGLVISGSPSGAGLVSGWSERRSYIANDRYHRRRIVEELRASGVPFIDSAPIARHWKRQSFRDAGVRGATAYRRWARERRLPDDWIDEQDRIDRACPFGFANVDHRKMTIVDGERAWIGSQNIADPYLYAEPLDDDPAVNVRRWQWHDVSAIIEGGAVRRLGRLFCRRWALSGGDLFDPNDGLYAPPHPARPPGHAVVALETSIPGLLRIPLGRNLGRLALSMLGFDRRPLTEGENPIRQRLFALGEMARLHLAVEHCYPSDPDLLGRWLDAARRLRDITLVAPLHYDTKVTGFECDRFFPEYIAAGARVMGYRRAIMHSKIAVADGFWVSTGSYNINLRSARADLELQFFVQDAAFGGAVRRAIESDLGDCEPVAPGPVDRFRGRFSLPIFDALVRYFIL